jgi:hypothetical protein
MRTGQACIRAHHTLSWQLAGTENPWVCGTCHPPARGLTVTWSDGWLERVGERQAAESADQLETIRAAA